MDMEPCRGSRRAAARTRASLIVALLFACLLPGQWAGALRLPEEQQAALIRVYAEWNTEYLCLAAKVPDPMLTGSSMSPMSAPEHDDAIEFGLELSRPQGTSAYRLVVSAARGMTVLSRDARGQWRPDSSWTSGPRTLKVYAKPDGTLNDPSDEDVGFVVECAIPWDFLGGEPPVGQDIGFNVVCWLEGDQDGIASWSPTVREPSDVGDTARWGSMAISQPATLAKAQGMRLPCPFVGHMPFIDGELKANEWLTASTLEFEKPRPTLPPPTAPHDRTGVPALLLAVYRYDWQGDPLRDNGAPLWRHDGLPATNHQPREAAGPWYSYESVDWHARQLAEIQRAGIDAILARYRADDPPRWARTGLDRLAQALKQRRAKDQGYPLVGMMLDTEPLQGVDLKSEEGKRLLYGMVRGFFLHLPREFWAGLGSQRDDSAAAGSPVWAAPKGVPVLLGEPDALADWDGGFVAYCQEQFAQDFDGARLAWLGSSAWRARGVEDFYAFVRLPEQTGFAQEGVAGATAVALSPGYCPPRELDGQVRPRGEGRAYRSDWQRALAARPELVVINSWNDFADGTEVGPSRQYGLAYVDMTGYFQSRLGSDQPQQLLLKQRRMPDVLQPGADHQVEFLVQNVGTDDLRTGRRVSADYHILRRSDGHLMHNSTAAQSLSVPAGQTRRLRAVISTKDDAGKPLPPGDYLFSLRVVSSRIAYLRSPWLARVVAELKVPFTVGEPPARKAALISSSLPSFIEAGAAENVVVRLRNDGREKWRPETTRLSYHWIRYRDDLMLPSSETRQLLEHDGPRAELPRAVAPGEIVSVMIPVTAAQRDGTPLAPSPPEDLWHYRVQWDLVEGEDGWFSHQGLPPAEEAIEVVSRDWGVFFRSAATPTKMEAGSTLPLEVALANAGHHTWKQTDTYHLTYSWYRWDGRAEQPPHDRLPTPTMLPAEVAPGEKIALTADLKAPLVPGMYWLAWDMVCEGEVFSASEAGKARGTLVQPVLVRGGHFRSLDLTALMNVPAITTDTHRAWGDFDGAGRSLPAECLPPDLSGAQDNLYPSGYYAAAAGTPIPFTFPETSSGVGGGVACAGQSISFAEARARRLHLLAGSTAGTQNIEVTLRYADGRAQLTALSVPSWMQREETLPNVSLAAYSPYLRSQSGDTATPAYLYLLTLTPDSPDAVSLELPKAPWVKILAITLETA